ncbi:MAG: 2-hydroxyacyl-CoA dehydratase [Planctomycetota bacterium]|jgi:benzoyl-CoA reductase/2-hydroxyglutaryl-CoA dehydratase subunit BcrC/BadD/HgdB|nr:2-hydroxyacyl-CoA dehydratase [Planctomycetota bacterium]
MYSGKIGITTTVPVEIIYAAGRVPVDLNNIFVAAPDAGSLVAYAEARGFPQSACAWTKGLYGVIHRYGIREVVGVVEGDCCNTFALCEVLKSEGIVVHDFGFPSSRRADDLQTRMERFAEELGTTLATADAEKERLDDIRKLARRLYELADAGCVPSGDLFGGLLNTSDFFGDPERCRKELADAVARAEKDSAVSDRERIRLSCVGVPTIITDLWDTFERLGGRFVDHELPRQFALLNGIGDGMVETYLRYTYPYDVFRRIEDVKKEAGKRDVRGIIHYIQSFCYRQIEDRLWREGLDLPILTLEADRPGGIDERSRTRVEAFMERMTQQGRTG